MSSLSKRPPLRGPRLYLYVNVVMAAIAALLSFTDSVLQACVRLTPLDGVMARLLVLYVLSVGRIAVMVRLFEWVETRHPKIHGDKKRELSDKHRRSIYFEILAYVATTDAVQYWYAEQQVLAPHDTWAGAALDALAFVPKSLCFELVFDLLYYAAHWYFHRNAWLYRNVHKRHHKHVHVCVLSTYQQNGLDVLLTNFLPMCAAISVGPRFTPFQLRLQFVYKTYVEVAGHCGLDVEGASFPQAPMLHEASGACIEPHDHDMHHTHPIYNFGKRFSVWDKLFGTYRSGRAAMKEARRASQASKGATTASDGVPAIGGAL